MRKQFLATVSIAILSAFSPAHAGEAAESPYADLVLKSLGGTRDSLGKYGVEVGLNYKADFWNAADGGAKRGSAYVGAATLALDVDNEKLLGIKGNSANLTVMNTHGGKPNSYVGSIQGVDNFEVATPATFVYEAWVQQNFLDDKVSILAGLRDLNVEFVVTDMSANFIKPVMQIGQDFAQTGQNGPSVYPVTALSGRLRVQPTDTSYIQAAIFDGVPGDLNRPRGTHINIANKDGALLIAEAGITPWNDPQAEGAANKFAIGAWTYTKQFPDFIEVDGSGDPVLQKSQGAYALASYQFYKDTQDRTVGGFLRIGATNGDVSQTRWAYEAGVVGKGWIPTRSEGEIGIGIAQAHNADRFIQATGDGTLHDEHSYEIYYLDTIAPGVTVQPDFQYISNPGTTAGVGDATLLGLRVNIDF